MFVTPIVRGAVCSDAQVTPVERDSVCMIGEVNPVHIPISEATVHTAAQWAIKEGKMGGPVTSEHRTLCYRWNPASVLALALGEAETHPQSAGRLLSLTSTR